MDRRKFLKFSGTAGIMLPSIFGTISARAESNPELVKALQQTDTDKVLIVIQLDGGNDALNTLVPVDQFDKLKQLRPNILNTESELLALNGNTSNKLHKDLVGIRSLYNEGRFRFIQSVGYPSHSSSHPTATTMALTGNNGITTGWLGRYLKYEYPQYPETLTPDPVSIEFGNYSTLLLQASGASMGVLMNDANAFCNLYFSGAVPPIGCDMNSPIPDAAIEAGQAKSRIYYLRQLTQVANQYAGRLKQAYEKGAGASLVEDREIACSPYKNSEFVRQLHIIARLIKGGLNTRVYQIKIGGYDTHSNVVQNHGNKMRELNEAITSFMKDLDKLGIADRVIGMTVSEFNRTIKENGSAGTDHATAHSMMIFGNAIAGGIQGTNPIIPDPAIFNDPAQFDKANNLAMQFDIRTIYSTILQQWFCLPSDVTASSAMLNGSFQVQPLLKNSPCGSTTVTMNISGQQDVCESGVYIYDVQPVAGAQIYNWVIVNGTILQGQGTSQIRVKWNNGTSGKIDVVAQ